MTEKLVDKIARLERELSVAKAKMAACPHEFGAPTRATREYQEAHYSHLEGPGAPHPVYNYRPRTEHGWEQTCATCGYVEYTAKTKPVVVGREPDFAKGPQR